jgi:uncharacterized membrane protein (DUF485 family)
MEERAMHAATESASPQRLEQTEWDRIAASQQFRHLLDRKRSFIIPAFVFFLAFYLLLPVLVGFAPEFMSTHVIGPVTLAYVFALAQFILGWTIAWLYIRTSAKFDGITKAILAEAKDPRGGA